MLIKFYEVNTNTQNGVYKISDFYNASWNLYKMSDNPKGGLVQEGYYQFDASDELAQLTITLTDYNYPHRITHIIAEAEDETSGHFKYTAYAVDRVEYMGQNQVKLHLIEDAFLSHIQEACNSKVILQRTNDSSFFYTHDISDVSNLRELKQNTDPTVVNYTGKWVLYTFKDIPPSDDNGKIYVKTKALDGNYELFSNKTAITNKYPEVTTKTPDAFNYFHKFVKTSTSYYQCQYNPSVNKLQWNSVQLTKAGEAYLVLSGTTNYDAETFLIPGDMKTVNIAFPFADNIYFNRGGGVSDIITSAFRVEDIGYKVNTGDNPITTIMPFLISKRIITGLNMNIQGIGQGDNVGDVYIENLTTSRYYQRGADDVYYEKVISPRTLTNTISFNIQLENNNLISDSEPFINYYLKAFGQTIPLKARYHDKSLYVKSSITSLNWNVNVYADNEQNVLFNGQINSIVPFDVDKFDEFLSQNSTYYQSIMTNLLLGGGTKLAIGTLSGALTRGGVGVGIGLLGGSASVAQQAINYGLQEKAMKDAPDTIKGTTTDYSNILTSTFGFYTYGLKAMEPSLSIMLTDLASKGFPVNNVISSITNNLTAQSNSIYGICKFIQGSLIGSVYNYHITKKINERLEGGIYLL